METVGSLVRSMNDNWRSYAIPIIAGLLAGFAMVGVYLGVLVALGSPAHAVDLLATDGFWVGLVALGFGTQIGLYAYLRVGRAASAAGATAASGMGTGTSALGMLACCGHHLADMAPYVALTGVGSLSGAIAFLSDWKYVIIALGLVANSIGIIITFQSVRKSRAHLHGMMLIDSFAAESWNN